MIFSRVDFPHPLGSDDDDKSILFDGEMDVPEGLRDLAASIPVDFGEMIQ